jgi:hypothetical protein
MQTVPELCLTAYPRLGISDTSDSPILDSLVQPGDGHQRSPIDSSWKPWSPPLVDFQLLALNSRGYWSCWLLLLLNIPMLATSPLTFPSLPPGRGIHGMPRRNIITCSSCLFYGKWGFKPVHGIIYAAHACFCSSVFKTYIHHQQQHHHHHDHHHDGDHHHHQMCLQHVYPFKYDQFNGWYQIISVITYPTLLKLERRMLKHAKTC